MTKYFIKRIGLAVLSLIIIATIVYFLLGLTKSSPISEENFIGKPEEFLKELQALGLDKPIGYRFLKYVADIFTGKGFGIIYRADFRNTTIPELFFKPLTYTLWITIPAFLFSTIVGISLGVLAGYKKGTWIDTLINVFVVIFIGVPSFVLAAIALTSGNLLGLPTAFIRPEDGGYKQMILSIILPIMVMTLSSLAIYTYTARNEVISVLKSNQVIIARAKGLDEWTVFKKYVFRNCSIALVALVLNSFLVLLVSSMVIETFFQVPGTSSIIISAVKNSEYNIVMFNTIFFVFLTLLIGIIIDLAFLLIDPRIKYASVSEFKFIKKFQAKNLRKHQQKNLSNQKNVNKIKLENPTNQNQDLTVLMVKTPAENNQQDLTITMVKNNHPNQKSLDELNQLIEPTNHLIEKGEKDEKTS